MSENNIKKIKIIDLIPDNLNANKGTEYGNHLIEKSFRELGAGRSILLDKQNRIIAGNKSIEAAASIGLENIIIVETTGEQVVAVKRTDIDLDSKQGRELAIADNATAKANIEWDADVIAKIEDDWQIDTSDWGVNLPNYSVGSEFNSMTDEDINLDEEFNPIGNSDGKQRVVFLFDNSQSAESYLNKLNVKFTKKGAAWQVNQCILST